MKTIKENIDLIIEEEEIEMESRDSLIGLMSVVIILLLIGFFVLAGVSG